MTEQQMAAMKQALDALDCIYSPLHVREINKVGEAMSALRQAIEQAENYQHKNPLGGPAKVFDAMADAIRAGDDYHATLRSYGFLEREDKKTIDCSGAAGPSITPLNWHSYADKQRALDKKAENARELGLDYEPVQAEKQEPVAWVDLENWLTGTAWPDDVFSENQLNGWTPLYTASPGGRQSSDCHTAAPVQEPVCHYCHDSHTLGSVYYDQNCVGCVRRMTATPQQRQWVSLSDEEAIDIGTQCQWYDGDCERFDSIGFARAIEAKLKQKNGYAEEKNT